MVTSFNCEIVLRSLARQAGRVGYRDLVPGLDEAAEKAAGARRAWLAAARSWDELTTDSRGRLSEAAVEAGNLALWTGRLAYADPRWTPARGPVHVLREPDSLAADPAAFAGVVAAVHYSADTLHRVAAASQDQVLAAAGAGRLYVPVRPGPGLEYRFSRRRQLTPVPGSRVEAVLATYAQSAEASQAAVHAAGRLAEATGAPSRVLAAAERHTELARRLTPRGGQLEQVLLDRGVKDPALLERAAAADRATREVMAEADRSQLGSQAAPRAQRGAAARELAGAGQAAHAEQAGVGEPARHAEPQAEVRVELQARQPPAAGVSPEYGAQVEAEMNEPEIEL